MRGVGLSALMLLAACTEGALVLGPIDGGQQLEDTGSPPADAVVDGGRLEVPTSLAAGGAHTCAVLGGAILCWGDGSSFGHPGRAVLAPLRIGTGRDWDTVVAGDDASCALREGEGIWCWGENGAGQLGLGDRSPRAEPTLIALPTPPRALELTRQTGCAILEDSALWCWGENIEGQLGRGGTYPGDDGLVAAPVASSLTFRDVGVGQGHTCAIATDGTLWCWGRNSNGQLGQGAGAAIQVRVPVRVGGRDDWVQVVAGQSHTCARRGDGTLWCWGEDFAGQVGVSLGGRFELPVQVGVDADWAGLSTFVFHTCGVKTDGTLWCWGRNAEGQLGLGDVVERTRPTRVGDRSDWAHVAAGRFHTCAASTDGTVWCAGDNDDGRLGVDDTARRDVLTLVVGFAVE